MGKFNSIFFKPTNKRLARIISLESPEKARASVKELKKGGISESEKKALVLASNRAEAQLKRKNLSGKERKEFSEINTIYRKTFGG